MSKAQNVAKPQHLPQFVGYSEIERALGVSRRTVERMVREGKFPKPVQLAPNRVGWQVEVVTAWLADRSKGLVAHAVTHPDQLAPDEVAPTMRMLAARLLEQELGEPVRLEQVSLTLSKVATNDELTSCRAKLLEHLENLCGHFSYSRCLYIAATLFPEFRTALDDSVDAAVIRDPELLRRFAIAILDDETWAQVEAGAKAAATEAKAKSLGEPTAGSDKPA